MTITIPNLSALHLQTAMSDVISWVSDQLHAILGLSDRFVAEYIVGLAKKCTSPETFESKLVETRTITVNQSVRAFINELWNKVPHKQVVEKPARAREREFLLQQQHNRSYRLLSDSDEDVPTKPVKSSRSRKKSIEVSKKRRNIRKEKVSTWDSESDEEGEAPPVKKSKEDSDDEWERQVTWHDSKDHVHLASV